MLFIMLSGKIKHLIYDYKCKEFYPIKESSVAVWIKKGDTTENARPLPMRVLLCNVNNK